MASLAEDAVKTPRLSISGLMVVVLIVAMNFGIGRALTQPPRLGMQLIELLIIGGFPMANVLAVGLAVLIAGHHRPGPNRPALVGFEAFGLAAWLAFLACSFLATGPTFESVRGVINASRLKPGFGLASFVAVLFLLPQVGFATLGIWLGRRHFVARVSPTNAGTAWKRWWAVSRP